MFLAEPFFAKSSQIPVRAPVLCSAVINHPLDVQKFYIQFGCGNLILLPTFSAMLFPWFQLPRLTHPLALEIIPLFNLKGISLPLITCITGSESSKIHGIRFLVETFTLPDLSSSNFDLSTGFSYEVKIQLP